MKTMCDYRYVKVRFPDRTEYRTVERVVDDDENGCTPCGLSWAAFKRRGLPPHDSFRHLELYGGAKVTRGRRLSTREIERRRLPRSVIPVPNEAGLLV